MKTNEIFKKNPDIVTRKIGDETVLVPIFKTSDEINCIYTFNEAAAAVWDMIDGKKTVDEIRKTILKKFDITPKEAEKKLEKLLKDLKEIKAINKRK